MKPLLIRVVIVTLAAGCLLFAEENTSPLGSLDLSKKELVALEKRANAGEKAAIMRLGAYYMIVRADDRSAARWHAKLAATGDAGGIYGYGMDMMNLGDFDEARKWLELAKEKHHAYAESGLQDLAKKIRDAATQKKR